MKMEGPLKTGALATPGEGGRELHIDFRDQFRADLFRIVR